VVVRGPSGNWRSAVQLSHGTQEQLYLLLRIAVTNILTRRGETCPLIFDDVSVHCDELRTDALLETLLELSATQQIIVFTQENGVLDWARERLGPNDSITELCDLWPGSGLGKGTGALENVSDGASVG
jgi:exonuclease SbcC